MWPEATYSGGMTFEGTGLSFRWAAWQREGHQGGSKPCPCAGMQFILLLNADSSRVATGSKAVGLSALRALSTSRQPWRRPACKQGCVTL